MPSKHQTTAVHKVASGNKPKNKAAWNENAQATANQYTDLTAEQLEELEQKREHTQAQIIEKLVRESTDLLQQGGEQHWLLDSKPFQAAVYTAIILNSIQMGVAIDYPDWTDVWTGFEHFFTAAFLLEMVIKLSFLRKIYFQEGWNRMDFFLVWMSVLDNWVIAAVTEGQDSPMGQLSVLRILRVLRIARMARLLKVFKELFVIVKGMFEALRTIFWVCLLLVLTMYVCSILLVDVMGRKSAPYGGWDDDIAAVEEAAGVDEWNNYLYFGTITRSMYTLFNIAMGEESTDIMRPVSERQFFMLFFFMAFIIFMSFGVLNVIIGVIVDSTHQAAKEMERNDVQKVMAEKLAVLLDIRDMMFALDIDRDCQITKEELLKGWDNTQLQDLLRRVELPKGFSPEEMLFLLDTDGDGKLTYEEFIISFYRVISDDPFQQACCTHASLNEVKRDCKMIVDKLEKEVQGIKDEMQSNSMSLKSEISSVSSSLKKEISAVSLSLKDEISSVASSLKRVEALLQGKSRTRSKSKEPHEQEC
eukprot:gnl/MRDRNA2_/MRDRNA2_145203_c0_seq1.p1 gnl/MRDRNA2_/MRDRNA2_145203_c0~~gnl/MRDRNA2_/MRDRNA2_145203_c0_seq1.p1  ORF type:complete len:532 (-),score=109.84 gnl/MRDRNA2_/MRDRNA2_145203_c0_seq1:538-2133(-)